MILNTNFDYLLFGISIFFFGASIFYLFKYIIRYYVKGELEPFTPSFHEIRYRIMFTSAISNGCAFFVYKFPSSLISGIGAVSFLLLTFMEIKNLELAHKLEKKEKENGNKKD